MGKVLLEANHILLLPTSSAVLLQSEITATESHKARSVYYPPLHRKKIKRVISLNAMSKEGGSVVLWPSWTRCVLVVSILLQELKKHTHVYHPTPSKVLCKDTEDEKNNSTEKFAAELPGYCLGLLQEGCGASLFDWKLGLCKLCPIMHVLSCDASDFNSIHAQLCIGIRSYIGVFL